jgi:hypothetical protein
MSQPAALTTVQPVVHHWLITLQMPVNNGFGVITTGGTLPIASGSSRAQVYREIRDALTRQDPALERADVLFFSLEPDQL